MSLVPITGSASLFPPFLLSFKWHLLFQSVGFLRPSCCSCLVPIGLFCFQRIQHLLTTASTTFELRYNNGLSTRCKWMFSAESNIDVSQPTPPLINSWKSMSWLSSPASPQRWNALSSWKSGLGVRWFWRFVNLFAPSETISQQSASSIVI